MRIYTRTGDNGFTSIHGRIRVPKTDIRIEANGTLDELNVVVGTIRTYLSETHPFQSLLYGIQVNLVSVMSLVATKSEMRGDNPNQLDDIVTPIERAIDSISAECTPSDSFILPGGTPMACMMHQARVLARKAERRLWRLNECDAVDHTILQYVNRLSDLFFLMARHELQFGNVKEEVWRRFGYKTKLKSK